jgi:hypothetical protein
MIKPRAVRWARHAAHKVEVRYIYIIVVENLKEIYSLEDLGVHGRIKLKSVLRNRV